MKKFFAFISIVFMVFALASCNGCNNGDKGQGDSGVVLNGYDYDSVVVSDYDYMASQYEGFYFYEVDVVFDTLLNAGTNVNILSIGTVFQVGDTCVMILHNPGKYDKEPEVVKEYGHWMECCDMTARNPISFDSCMVLIDGFRCNLPTSKMTFRRPLAPPFPKYGQYIFGMGYLFVDSQTGQIDGIVSPCK